MRGWRGEPSPLLMGTYRSRGYGEVTCITENIVLRKRLNCKEYFTNIRLNRDDCATSL
jgi:hypothetical protein